MPVAPRLDVPRKHRLVVLAAGNGSNLQAIFDACDAGRLSADVVLVVSHRAEAHALVRAQKRGVATACRTLAAVKAQGGTRDDLDRWLAEIVAEAAPDLVICAGWMLILGPEFLRPLGAKTINLHPALPGAFVGKDAIGDAWRAAQLVFEAGRHEAFATGVMVHEVVAELDAGTPIAVEYVPIAPGESLDSLTARMHVVEHAVLVRAIGVRLGQLTS